MSIYYNIWNPTSIRHFLQRIKKENAVIHAIENGDIRKRKALEDLKGGMKTSISR